MGLPVSLALRLDPVVQTVAPQQRLDMTTQNPLLLHQLSPGAQQIPILLNLRIRYRHHRQQAVRVEFGQFSRIDTIRLYRLPSASWDARRCHHRAVIALVLQIALQREANVGRLVAEFQLRRAETFTQPLKLSHEAFQCGTTVEVQGLARMLIQRATMVTHVIDIDPDRNYVLSHRRLPIALMLSTPEISITDGNPRGRRGRLYLLYSSVIRTFLIGDFNVSRRKKNARRLHR